MSAYPPAVAEAITPGMVQALGQTKPWVRFLSILGFLSVGLMLLLGLFVMVASAAGGLGRHSPFSGAGGVALGAIYLLFGVLYLFPSLFLFRYASAIGEIRAGQEAAGMERALEAQKSFWRFVGIMALVIMVIYAMIIGAAIVMAVIAASSRRF